MTVINAKGEFHFTYLKLQSIAREKYNSLCFI